MSVGVRILGSLGVGCLGALNPKPCLGVHDVSSGVWGSECWVRRFWMERTQELFGFRLREVRQLD